MSKPQKPTWGYGDPSYAITPSAGKQAVGWLPGEKPPYQYMNWIHLRSGEWFTYLENKTETISPTMLRSNSTLSWNGSTITYTQPIDVSFRVTTGEQINRIGVSASPIALADGQVLVFIKDKTNASPVTLASGTYSTLIAGQYAILNESTLTAVSQENEVVLFRRRGSVLEIPVLGQVFPSGAVITLGQSYVGLGTLATAGFLMPIGSIVPFYDYNGALTFDGAYWSYCDGSTVTINGVSRVTPDLSGRYLVGFGTDGGGDIDSAAWATTAVGLAGNIINLQHNHTVNSHVHPMAHTHQMGIHTHGAGSLQFQVAEAGGSGGGGYLYGYDAAGAQIRISQSETVSAGAGAIVADNFNVAAEIYYTAAGFGSTQVNTTQSTGVAQDPPGVTRSNTDATSPGTDNQLSTVQSIQPRSIRVRYLIRTN